MRKYKKVLAMLFIILIFCGIGFILIDEYVCYTGEKYMIGLDEEIEDVDAL
ncbi:unnamed protein product [marine sediment metagenome]|uniref:Uncharacterized protein n=1 Tax=marine sediment metagenome TaxID=412755 RepID=X1UJD8_9ZZZZ